MGHGIAVMQSASGLKPHRNYLRYRAGCRCDDCRGAQSEYARERHRLRGLGQRNGIVSAARAREHLATLQSEHGVHVDAIATLTGINRRDLMQIRNGRQLNLREAREREILSVGPNAVHANGKVPAAETRKRLKRIREAGLTQKEINTRLGVGPKTRVAKGRYVLAANARKVWVLYWEVVIVGGQQAARERRRQISAKGIATAAQNRKAA